MSQNVDSEVLLELLNRAPGASMCGVTNLATGVGRWVFVSANAAEMYDVPEPEFRESPEKILVRVVPEDRAHLDALMLKVMPQGGQVSWTGRVLRRDGETRWLETQTSFVPRGDGTMIWYMQGLDVTERKKLEEERARAEAIHRAVLDVLPLGVTVLNTAGQFLVYNPAQEGMSGRLPTAEAGNDMMNVFGVTRADGVTPFPDAEMPIVRALYGESAVDEMVLRNAALETEKRLLVHARPLQDGSGKVFAALAVSQDVTEQRLLEQALRARNEELAASEAAKAQLIERLRYSIDELSNPILEVWDDVLAMPIIGVVDSRRTADMVQRLLSEVARTQASFVIIDLTGVEIVDTKTADHLMKLMRKVEVIGARCVLTGIRAAVAETLVDIGVDFGSLTTLRNLKHGLREALRGAKRERNRGLDLDEGMGGDAKAKRSPS